MVTSLGERGLAPHDLFLVKTPHLTFQIEEHLGQGFTHGQVPTPLLLNDRVRIFFASRPRKNFSQTHFVDFDLELKTVLHVETSPIVEVGNAGHFDEFGIMPDCAIRINPATIFLYYSGWKSSETYPHENYTGLAISKDGGNSFEKYSSEPVLGKTKDDPFSATSCFVIRDGKGFQMFYSSGVSWMEIEGRLEHSYDIKCAWSSDGIKWDRNYEPIIKQRHKFEGLARPTVFRVKEQWIMIFSEMDIRDFRDGAGSYQLGCAISKDLRSWHRLESNAFRTLKNLPESCRMQAYPYVCLVNGELNLFYNGNSFGSAGFYASKIVINDLEQTNER